MLIRLNELGMIYLLVSGEEGNRWQRLSRHNIYTGKETKGLPVRTISRSDEI